METVLQLFLQIVTMFLLAAVGYLLFRAGKITEEGSRSIGNVLIFLVLPAVIIKGFLIERTPESIKALLISILMAAVSLAVCVAVSRLAFRKDGIAAFATAFSNPGFFGVPLITALLGDGAVAYIAAFIAFTNLLQFTYGRFLITGDKKGLSAKTVMTAPFMIAILIGLLLFFTQLPLPGLITKTLGYISNMNTPLAMIAVGIYLAQTDMLAMFKRISLYQVSFFRLAVVPLIVLVILIAVPQEWMACKMAILIASACPAGSNVAVYAQLYHGDYRYAVETVVVTTIFSLITIPAVMWLAQLLW